MRPAPQQTSPASIREGEGGGGGDTEARQQKTRREMQYSIYF